MGGRALKEVYTRRYEYSEYHSLCDELLPIISKIFNTEVSLVESFKDKESFGDMDILVLGEISNDLVKEKLIENFNPPPTQISCNSNVTSFEHKELQIDLIFTKESNWESSKLFFKFGDLGNLLGKMYNRVDLKYGFSGLVKVIRDENDSKKLGNVVISTEGKKIFEFMGLSWNRYCEGFNNEKEIFDYIIESRFFDPEAFKFENLNHTNRKRNQRRKGYKDFIKYVEDLKLKPKYTFDETDETKHIDEIEKFFNIDLKSIIKKYQDEDDIKKLIRSKFNGSKIIEWIDIKPGKIISILIEEFKEHISNTYDYNKYVLENTEKVIKNKFKKYYDERKIN